MFSSKVFVARGHRGYIELRVQTQDAFHLIRLQEERVRVKRESAPNPGWKEGATEVTLPWSRECSHYVWSAGYSGWCCSDCGSDVPVWQQWLTHLETTTANALGAAGVILMDSRTDPWYLPDRSAEEEMLMTIIHQLVG